MASEHEVRQGTQEWLDMRTNRFNGSEIASLIGLNHYKGQDPKSAMINKRNPQTVSEQTQTYFDHGHAYETLGLAKFIDAMSGRIRQSYTLPSGYYTPTDTNMNFLGMDDDLKYGVSLDGEGSMYDVEVKNPYRYWSFKQSYLDKVSVNHFVQCQWAMAIRERSSMYYVATHFDPQTTQFLAIVIWKIDFDVRFFNEVIYPLAHKAYDNFKMGRENDLPWIDENEKFSHSKEWQDIFESHCSKVYSKIEGHLISQIIKNKQQ